jgi:hypothetical protein
MIEKIISMAEADDAAFQLSGFTRQHWDTMSEIVKSKYIRFGYNHLKSLATVTRERDEARLACAAKGEALKESLCEAKAQLSREKLMAGGNSPSVLLWHSEVKRLEAALSPTIGADLMGELEACKFAINQAHTFLYFIPLGDAEYDRIMELFDSILGGKTPPENERDELVGKWLSAALEDDSHACEEFKADIRKWFDTWHNPITPKQPTQ